VDGGGSSGQKTGGDPGEGNHDGGREDGGESDAGEIGLSVTVKGPGIVKGKGFECGMDTCATTLLANVQAVLIATPNDDAAFGVWRGPCAEDMNDGVADQVSASFTCTLASGTPLDVTAEFAGDHWFDLKVARSGSGKGTVGSVDGRIVCDGSSTESCSARYIKGASVTLAAAPAVPTTDVFSGWGGACSGVDTCTVTMADQRVVDAVFNLDGFGALIVTKPGKGRGFIQSAPEGVSCGDQCSASFSLAASVAPIVMLTAQADDTSTFGGFTGDCMVQADRTTCLATVDGIERVSADFAFKSYGLSITWAGNGEGKVSAALDDGSALSCAKPEACVKQVEFNTTAVLTAEPLEGSMFVGWSGSGCGLEPTCRIDVMSETMVVANFAVREPSLTVGVTGEGAVSCNGMPCAMQYVYGTSITFDAMPAAGWQLSSWDGACAGTPVAMPCVKTITVNAAVLATFTRKQYKLAVTIAGTGTGSVAGTLACDGSQKQPCTAEVSKGDAIKLTASPAAGSTFAGWGGACGGTGECALDAVSGDVEVTANFTKKVAGKTTLVVAKTGKGTITSAPAGIACAAGCSGANASFTEGSTVELTAAAAVGYGAPTFKGCDTTTGGKCQIAMNDSDAMEEIAVAFAPSSVPVTVAIAGNGTGNVAGAGITCATGNTGDCSENQPFDSTYVLVATASAGSTFAGWDAMGACAGVRTPRCEIKVDQSNAVTATFTLRTFRIQSSTTGGFDGSSTVLRNPVGAACVPASADCSMYGFGTDVTLTATPGAGSSFVRWTGDAASCAGNASCPFADLSANKQVGAEFAARSYQVDVEVTGAGLITSKEMPPRINCTSGGSSCAAAYPHNSSVTLEADTQVPLPPGVAGLRFVGWSGACTGSAQCSLGSLTASKSVGASFADRYAATVTLAGTVADDATSYVSGPDKFACQGNADPCRYLGDAGASVTFTATPPPGTEFAGWDGVRCEGDQASATCTFALSAAVNLTARFATVAKPRMLSIVLAGNGAGGTGTLVTANWEGRSFTCGRNTKTCVATINQGSRVELVATPPRWASLESFAGPCLPNNGETCEFTMTGDETVTATFASRGNLMFVTSAAHAPDWGLTGGPGDLCTAAARAGGLDTFGTFVPWISSWGVIPDPAIGLYSAATLTTASIIRVDGEVVSKQGLNALLVGGAAEADHAPINITELGAPLGDRLMVWTGTSGSGQPGSYCRNWIPDPSVDEGTIGDPNSRGISWTEQGVALCSELHHLYCIQDTR
jgi:hypothetical protein